MCENHDFVHLHLHTEYSLLDGFARIDRVIDYAKDLGMPALGITDHGTMFGVIDFYKACKAADIKPIIGVEAYLAPNTRFGRTQQDTKPYHMLLMAANKTGYQNLLKLSSEAQLTGYYYRPRIDRELMAAHAEGVIATSGCLAAEIPRMLETGQEEKARELIGWYQDVFGKDNFFLELQAHDIPELDRLNRWLVENSKYANVPLLATNDVHYVRREDYEPHDTLLCIQTSSLKNAPNRLKMTDNSYYLRTQQEMWALFGDYPQALCNSLLIAERCEDLELSKQTYHLPVFPVPSQFADAGDYLRYLCERGLEWRYGEQAHSDPKFYDRLDHELKIIHRMGFDTYFLIVWDLCEFARRADIWWNVRGSGAGSLVAYTLGITSLDPLENGLLFERFLNPGRVSMPDFDLDYPEDRRMEMIEYCTRKYGEDKVAAIITFGTLGAKAAIRDVGRALDIPLTYVDQIVRTIPQVPKLPSIPELIGDDPEKVIPDLKEKYQTDETARKIIDTAAAIEGVPRHASTHAAGIIVADKPLVEYIPLHRPTKGDAEDSPVKMVTQFPMETAESIGLLKIDFLGLSTLTILRKACELIEQYHGIKYTMDNIPIKPVPNDPEVTRRVEEMFEMIGEGHTIGVFQIESPGMRQMLTGMRPKTFEHIIAAISLYRPGPMDYIPTFNNRMHGKEPVVYHHPKLVPIVENTYGILVYQEQIMQVAAELFGYELGEADMMRRAVSKKKEKDLLKHRQTFLERGPDHGVDEIAAGKIFDDIEFFARYGFNKCVVGSTEIIDAQTGRLIKVEDLANGTAQVAETLSMNESNLRLQHGKITAVMNNGVKPVYRLTTQLGRQIDATANHPFYTFDGWQLLGELQAGDRIAVPRCIPVEGQREWADNEVIALAKSLSELDSLPAEIFEITNRQIDLLLTHMSEPDSVGTGYILSAPVRTRYITSLQTQRIAHQLQHLMLRLGHIASLEQANEGYYQVVEVAEAYIDAPLPDGTNDIYWDRVVSIEYIGEQTTYDLTIEDTHNFIANDIIVHNSHAADYAVITCQTAYLKCHYPHEYMSALMSVYFDDSNKVSLFAADCRRMGIDVLPPNVNYSYADFSIEQWENSKHIRFGMGAIKNVGTAAVEYLIKRRGHEPFHDLDNFLKRCDMRELGKRALESLIKVGAMDDLGDRAIMLANLEKLMSYSTEHHKNAAIGQVSMFDFLGGSARDNNAGSVLSMMTDKAPEDWNKREQLRWEKTLMGLYVSDHPLNQIWSQVQRAITHTTADLAEEHETIKGRRVTVAGLVSDTRHLVTKHGEPMAVLTLEDIQGSIEVVMFPRTWGTFRDIVEVDKVFVVRGEADIRGTDVQIKADTLETNFSITSAADEQMSLLDAIPYYVPYEDDLDEETGEVLKTSHEPPPPPPSSYIAPATDGASTTHQRLEKQVVAPPPSDDEKPNELPQNTQDTFEEPADFQEFMNHSYTYDDEALSYISEYTDEYAAPLASPTPPPQTFRTPTHTAVPNPSIEKTTVHGIPSAFVRRSQPVEEHPLSTLIVVMERTLEAQQDRRRLRKIVGVVSAYPGKDHFCVVYLNYLNRPTRMDFPSIKTHIHQELEDELLKMVGVLRVELRPGGLSNLTNNMDDYVRLFDNSKK